MPTKKPAKKASRKNARKAEERREALAPSTPVAPTGKPPGVPAELRGDKPAGQLNLQGSPAARQGVAHDVNEVVYHVYRAPHYQIRLSEAKLEAIRGADDARKRKSLVARGMRPISKKGGRRRKAEAELPPEDPLPFATLEREELLAAIMAR